MMVSNGYKVDGNTKIYVAGHKGLIGSAFIRRLESDGYKNIITAAREELELTDSECVNDFFSNHKPEVVVLTAGKVGGIINNRDYPADFIQENLSIQLNVFSAAQKYKVKKLIFFGSSCMYPQETTQPMKESQLCIGHPEPTSVAYATAKYAGVQMCQAINRQNGRVSFIPVIPNSAYGPNDNFDLNNSHVLSALVRRFYEAKERNISSVTLWGSGKPKREFVHADDIVDACLMLLNRDLSQDELPINIGVGEDVSIKELANKIKKIIDYTGDINWDNTKPDGVHRKLLDSSRIKKFGWEPKVNFDNGLKEICQWYIDAIK